MTYCSLSSSFLFSLITIIIADTMTDASTNFVSRISFASSTNLAADWKLFKAQLNIYMVAKKFDKMGEEEKIANALLLMGSESVPIYGQFVFGEAENEQKTLANVLKMFEKHCEPVKNTIYERVKFNSLKQGELSIHQFITALQSQADVCDYGEMRDELVRDRIVVGVNDAKLREYLIDVDNLTLASCIQKSKQYVSHHEHVRKMEASGNDENIDVLGKGKYKGSRPYGTQGSGSSKTCFFCNKEPHGKTSVFLSGETLERLLLLIVILGLSEFYAGTCDSISNME